MQSDNYKVITCVFVSTFAPPHVPSVWYAGKERKGRKEDEYLRCASFLHTVLCKPSRISKCGGFELNEKFQVYIFEVCLFLKKTLGPTTPTAKAPY